MTLKSKRIFLELKMEFGKIIFYGFVQAHTPFHGMKNYLIMPKKLEWKFLAHLLMKLQLIF